MQKKDGFDDSGLEKCAEKRQDKQRRRAVVAYQQEGPDVGDLVKLHEKPKSLLMVTAVLAVHWETIPLQNNKKNRSGFKTKDWILLFLSHMFKAGILSISILKAVEIKSNGKWYVRTYSGHSLQRPESDWTFKSKSSLQSSAFFQLQATAKKTKPLYHHLSRFITTLLYCINEDLCINSTHISVATLQPCGIHSDNQRRRIDETEQKVRRQQLLRTDESPSYYSATRKEFVIFTPMAVIVYFYEY